MVLRVLRATGLAGLCCAGVLGLAILSMVYTPYDPAGIDIARRFSAPSLNHLLGTDHLGRDIASGIIAGARTSMQIALLGVGVGAVTGILWGMLAAGSRWFDGLLMRSADVIFAFPVLLLAILLTAALGPRVMNATIAVAVFNIPVFAQLTRGAANGLWQSDFVAAARVAGKPTWRISRDHILPNIAPLLVVQVSVQLAVAIGAEAALSFIGLGAPPEVASWGRMLADAQTMMGWSLWPAIISGLAISVSVLSFSMLGDRLRDMLDPRLMAVPA